MRYFKNRLLDSETLENLGFKHIIHNYYDYRSQHNHVRYNLITHEIWINEVKMFNDVYTLWELQMSLCFMGVWDDRQEENTFKNLKY